MQVPGRPASPLTPAGRDLGEALFVSPHYDDVAFSCAATIAEVRRMGGTARLVTVFTRGRHPASGFALECQVGKGVAEAVDYMALRRSEDDRFATLAGVPAERLDLLEAPHRGYESSAALFGEELASDQATAAEVAARLAALVEERRPSRVWVPLGIGGHVDHRIVRRAALEALAARGDGWGAALYLYPELPYLLRATGRPALPAGDLGRWRWVGLDRHVAFKVEAVRCYASQLGFQLRGLGGPRDLVLRGGGASAALAGLDRPVEVAWTAETGPDE